MEESKNLFNLIHIKDKNIEVYNGCDRCNRLFGPNLENIKQEPVVIDGEDIMKVTCLKCGYEHHYRNWRA